VISINLLPAEYRKTESTPIGRFLTIVVGAVLVTSGLVTYGYVHYSQLRMARDVREATEAEYGNKKALADESKALQAEIDGYEARRNAIQQIVKGRIMHSRKLDELLDIVHNKGDRSSYYVWLKGLTVTPGRTSRRGKASSGGTISFDGFAESADITRVTNLRDALRKDAFYEDIANITMPNFKAEFWDDGLEPSAAGRFGFSMTLRPLGWRHATSKKKKK